MFHHLFVETTKNFDITPTLERLHHVSERLDKHEVRVGVVSRLNLHSSFVRKCQARIPAHGLPAERCSDR